MADIFEPFNINGMVVKNRFVRSATMDHFAENGMVSDTEIDLYRELACGEVGLIISHGLCPSPNGWVSTGQLRIDSDETIPSLEKLVKVVHENNGKIAAQIMHGGWFSNPAVTGTRVVGPSSMINPAKRRGEIKYSTGLTANVERASICSVTRMVPSSAAIEEPALAATTNPVKTGPNSRVIDKATTVPTSDSALNRLKATKLCKAKTIPVKAPVMIVTGRELAPTSSICRKFSCSLRGG